MAKLCKKSSVCEHHKYTHAGLYSQHISLTEPQAITNLDKLHPLHSLGADGHHGEADGGANNAVSPRDRQFEEGGD